MSTRTIGRPKISIDPARFIPIYERWRRGEITARTAQKELGMKPDTFYRRVREFSSSQQTTNKSVSIMDTERN